MLSVVIVVNAAVAVVLIWGYGDFRDYVIRRDGKVDIRWDRRLGLCEVLRGEARRWWCLKVRCKESLQRWYAKGR